MSDILSADLLKRPTWVKPMYSGKSFCCSSGNCDVLTLCPSDSSSIDHWRAENCDEPLVMNSRKIDHDGDELQCVRTFADSVLYGTEDFWLSSCKLEGISKNKPAFHDTRMVCSFQGLISDMVPIDDGKVIVGAEDFTLSLINIETGSRTVTFCDGTDDKDTSPLSICTNTKDIVASSFCDSSIRLFDLKAGSTVATLPANTSGLPKCNSVSTSKSQCGLAFDSSGDLYVASYDGIVKSFDVRNTSQPVSQLLPVPSGTNPLTDGVDEALATRFSLLDIQTSPNGSQVLTVSEVRRSRIHFFNLGDLESRPTFVDCFPGSVESGSVIASMCWFKSKESLSNPDSLFYTDRTGRVGVSFRKTDSLLPENAKDLLEEDADMIAQEYLDKMMADEKAPSVDEYDDDDDRIVIPKKSQVVVPEKVAPVTSSRKTKSKPPTESNALPPKKKSKQQKSISTESNDEEEEQDEEYDDVDENDILAFANASQNDEADGVDDDYSHDGETNDDGDADFSLKKIRKECAVNSQRSKGPKIGQFFNSDDEDVSHTDFVSAQHGPKLKWTSPRSPFQPGSTPVDVPSRFMLWNEVGIIRHYSSDSGHESAMMGDILDVEFHDTAIHHALTLPNPDQMSMASLSETALVFASNKHLWTIPLRVGVATSASSKEWRFGAPKDDHNSETFLAIATGSNFVAAATSFGFLRTFLLRSAIQLPVISLPANGPILCMSGRRDILVVVQHASSQSVPLQETDVADGDLPLVYSVFRVFTDQLRVAEPLVLALPLPLTPRSSLVWLSFASDLTASYSSHLIVTMDSAHIVRSAPISATKNKATNHPVWSVVANLRGCAKNPVVDSQIARLAQTRHDHLWPVSAFIRDQSLLQMRGVVCRGKTWPDLLPRPVLSLVDLATPPLLKSSKHDEDELSSDAMFEAWAPLLRVAAMKDDTNETTLQAGLMKLFAVVCRSDNSVLASLDIANLMPNSRSVQLAIKYATRISNLTLADRLSAIARAKLATEEESLENDDLAESPFITPLHRQPTHDFSDDPSHSSIHKTNLIRLKSSDRCPAGEDDHSQPILPSTPSSVQQENIEPIEDPTKSAEGSGSQLFTNYLADDTPEVLKSRANPFKRGSSTNSVPSVSGLSALEKKATLTSSTSANVPSEKTPLSLKKKSANASKKQPKGQNDTPEPMEKTSIQSRLAQFLSK